LDGTTGGHGGESRSGGGTVVLRSGFKGTLNDPPQTLEDSVEWGVDKTLKVRVSSLLANDRDPDGDTVRLLRFDALSAAGGTVVLDQGWLLYTPPNPNLSSDSFSYTVEDAAGHVASGQVTVVADAPDGEPSRNLVAIILLPDGRRRLQFVGIAGRTYRIQASDQMPAVLWETQASLVADSRGRVDWIDPTQPAPPERYYRTVYP
jgi:nitrogen fixation protein